MQYATKQKPNNMRITHFTRSVAGLNKKGMMADGRWQMVENVVFSIHLQSGPLWSRAVAEVESARLFDHCSGYHAAATDHVFQRSRQSLNVMYT